MEGPGRMRFWLSHGCKSGLDGEILSRGTSCRLWGRGRPLLRGREGLFSRGRGEVEVSLCPGETLLFLWRGPGALWVIEVRVLR